MNPTIISPNWLQANLHKQNVIILDASPQATATGRSSAYAHLCIPHARIVDLKKQFADPSGRFPNTIPSPAAFEQACRSLGIDADAEIVIYDNIGIYTSPRLWWLFKVMGHQDVKVLDGGLPAWIEAGGETLDKQTLNQEYEPGNFTSDFHKEYVISYANILENQETKDFLVVDARSQGRFEGTSSEPRKHLKSGHIPDSINIPYAQLLDKGKFKSTEELHAIFSSKIADQEKLVFSCGSGITACIVMLASEIAFQSSPYVYDGSWTEYAELEGLKNE